jgi:hypothetical protein
VEQKSVSSTITPRRPASPTNSFNLAKYSGFHCWRSNFPSRITQGAIYLSGASVFRSIPKSPETSRYVPAKIRV